MKLRLFFFSCYSLAGGLSMWAAFWIRFYLDPLPPVYDAMMWQAIPWAVLLAGGAAEWSGLTRGIWRSAGFPDLRQVVWSQASLAVLILGVALSVGRGNFPNGPLLLFVILNALLTVGIRFSGRSLREAQRLLGQGRTAPERRVLVIGLGGGGELALRSLFQPVPRRNVVVGILAEDERYTGRMLLGVRVLGTLEDLPAVLAAQRPQDVVVARPDLPPERLREIFSLCTVRGIRVERLPGFQEISGGDLSCGPFRKLRLEDFLRREPVQLPRERVADGLKGCKVLITGAGGTIGAELARQLAAFPLAGLMLLDVAETPLFEIEQELRVRALPFPVSALLLDIREGEALTRHLAMLRPDVIFHAAAYKHVPMLETHPLEAARTNVQGTWQTLQAAAAAGVQRFCNVSTDKAVHPASVMGASKALAEQLVAAVAADSGHAYVSVRFGNVLGSNGSVIPQFERQMQRDGVLQVTDAEATRYFMTIQEAVTLLIHAESLRGSGEVYLLDMGEPVRIQEVAEQLLKLSDPGLSPETGIRYTGLRPGERLHERLLADGETLAETAVPKVRCIRREAPPLKVTWLPGLQQAMAAQDAEQVRHLLFAHSGNAKPLPPELETR